MHEESELRGQKLHRSQTMGLCWFWVTLFTCAVLNMLLYEWGCRLVGETAQRPGHPHPVSDLTSSRRPSLFSGSAPEGGCWAMELSDSGSTSVTAAALGSDTSLQKKERGGWGEGLEKTEFQGKGCMRTWGQHWAVTGYKACHLYLALLTFSKLISAATSAFLRFMLWQWHIKLWITVTKISGLVSFHEKHIKTIKHNNDHTGNRKEDMA